MQDVMIDITIMPADSCSGRLRAGGCQPEDRRQNIICQFGYQTGKKQKKQQIDPARNRRRDLTIFSMSSRRIPFSTEIWKPGRDYDEKRKYLRSLMNIRMPGAMDEDVVRFRMNSLPKRRKRKAL